VRLQGMLDEINAGHAPELDMLLNDLVTGRPWVATFTGGPVTIHRAGRSLAFTASSIMQPFWDLISLLLQVGIDRVRRCALPGCNRWFVAAKGQLFDTYEHAQRDRDRRKRERRTR
jgi:hypothetical protein